jgi:di/tricarboxylate transporter
MTQPPEGRSVGLRRATMMRCGLWLNLVCIAVIVAMTVNR